jgi:hypothetical protein
VKIPEDWKSSYPEEGTTSSEQYFPLHAEARHSSGGGGSRSSHYREPGVGPDGQPEPYFDHAMMTNLSVILGQNIFLNCRVKNLGKDQTVRAEIDSSLSSFLLLNEI